MAKRIMQGILILVCVLLFMPCEASGPGVPYELIEEKYEYQDAEQEVKIAYPQIANLSDANKQNASAFRKNIRRENFRR